MGIMVYNPVAPGIVIEKNEIFNFDEGVGLAKDANDVIVRLNNLHNTQVGVQLENGATRNTISDNDIVNNAVAGIRFDGGGNPSPSDPPGPGNVCPPQHNFRQCGRGHQLRYAAIRCRIQLLG